MFCSILLLLLVFTSFPAYAAAQPYQSSALSFVPMVLVFVVFYFLIIRPHKKKTKEHETMLSSIKAGDKIVTSSGLIGTVISVESEPVSLFVIEIAAGTSVKILRTHVSDLFSRISSDNKEGLTKAKSVKKDSNQ